MLIPDPESVFKSTTPKKSYHPITGFDGGNGEEFHIFEIDSEFLVNGFGISEASSIDIFYNIYSFRYSFWLHDDKKL